MKKMSLVFLEKSELQHSGNSTLIELLGVTSIWGSQNGMFQWKHFRSNIAIFDRGETMIIKKNLYAKTENRAQIFTFSVKLFDRFKNC